MPVDDWPVLPRGGVTVKKYAAICLALGMVRGALYAALEGDMEGAKDILEDPVAAGMRHPVFELRAA